MCQAPIDIALDDKRIPQRLLLVIDVPAVPDGAATGNGKDRDCTCDDTATPRTPSQADIASAPGVYSTDLGTRQCVDFMTPNRAIEEFSFYTLVRTTEPAIRGLTVGARGGLPPAPSGGQPGGAGVLLPMSPPGQPGGAGGGLPQPPPGQPGGAGGGLPQPPPGQPSAPASGAVVPAASQPIGAAAQPASTVMAATAAPGTMDSDGLDVTSATFEARLAANNRLLRLAWDRDSRFLGTLTSARSRTCSRTGSWAGPLTGG
jgi:hypothetical protein